MGLTIKLLLQEVYYQARLESEENLELMRLLDEQFTQTPFYGVEKMTALLRAQGWKVNPKRVRPAVAADGFGSGLSEAESESLLWRRRRRSLLLLAERSRNQ